MPLHFLVVFLLGLSLADNQGSSGPTYCYQDDSLATGTCSAIYRAHAVTYPTNTPNTPNNCYQYCRTWIKSTYSYIYNFYYGVSEQLCFCGLSLRSYPVLIPLDWRTFCDTPCSGDGSVYCGGDGFLGVYGGVVGKLESDGVAVGQGVGMDGLSVGAIAGIAVGAVVFVVLVVGIVVLIKKQLSDRVDVF